MTRRRRQKREKQRFQKDLEEQLVSVAPEPDDIDLYFMIEDPWFVYEYPDPHYAFYDGRPSHEFDNEAYDDWIDDYLPVLSPVKAGKHLRDADGLYWLVLDNGMCASFNTGRQETFLNLNNPEIVA